MSKRRCSSSEFVVPTFQKVLLNIEVVTITFPTGLVPATTVSLKLVLTHGDKIASVNIPVARYCTEMRQPSARSPRSEQVLAVQGETLSLVLPLLFSCQTNPHAPCVTLVTEGNASSNQALLSVTAITKDTETGFSRSVLPLAQSLVPLSELINDSSYAGRCATTRSTAITNIALFMPAALLQGDAESGHVTRTAVGAPPPSPPEAPPEEPVIMIDALITAKSVGGIQVGAGAHAAPGDMGARSCPLAQVSRPDVLKPETVQEPLQKPLQEPRLGSFALTNVTTDLDAIDDQDRDEYTVRVMSGASTSSTSSDFGGRPLSGTVDAVAASVRSPTVALMQRQGTVATAVERINKLSPACPNMTPPAAPETVGSETSVGDKAPEPLAPAVPPQPSAQQTSQPLAVHMEAEAAAEAASETTRKLMRLMLAKLSCYRTLHDGLAQRQEHYDSQHLSRRAHTTIQRLEQVLAAQTTRIHQLCGLLVDPITASGADSDGSVQQSVSSSKEAETAQVPKARSARSILAAARKATQQPAREYVASTADGLYSEAVSAAAASLYVADLTRLLHELLPLYEAEVAKNRNTSQLASAAVFHQCVSGAETDQLLADLIAAKMQSANMADELEDCRCAHRALHLELARLRRAQSTDSTDQALSGGAGALAPPTPLAFVKGGKQLDREFRVAGAAHLAHSPSALPRVTIQPKLKPRPLVSPATGTISKFQIVNDDTSPESSDEDLWT